MGRTRRVHALLVSTLLVLVTGVGGFGSIEVAAQPAQDAEPRLGGDDQEELPAAAPAWSYDPNESIAEGDIEARMEAEDIDREEAIRRFRIGGAAAVLQAEAERRWPETFAGLWIERDPYAVKVAFTDRGNERVAELREEFSHPSVLQPVDAKRSLTALRALEQRMADDRGRLEQDAHASNFPASMRETAGKYDLNIAVPDGTVEARVERATPQLETDFKGRYGPGIVLREGISQPTTCYINSCDPAMMGGLSLRVGTDRVCSSAFFARWRPNNARAVLSAGHCGGLYEENRRYHNNTHVGDVSYIEWHRRWDAERITVAATWRESSKFFVEGEDPRMLKAWMPWSQIVIGEYIGKTGRTTGTTRGWVLSRDYRPNNDIVPNAEPLFIHATLCAAGGDSGGASWRSHTGWGIVSSATPESCDGTQPPPGVFGGKAVIGSIEFAQDALDVWLPSGVNIPPIARMTRSCTGVLERTCTFRGENSDDHDGSIVSYTWEFSDGTKRSGATVTHTFPLLGNHWARLTVKDNDGATHSVREDFAFV